MELRVKSEIFAPGSQAVQVARILGWERHRVIGALADLWHNSQAAEAIQGDQESIGLWSTLRRAEDQRRFISALTQGSYLVDLGVQDGVNQWLIVGNEKHVKSKKHQSEAQRLRALARWEKERKSLSENMPAADASAVQSSAVQSSAVHSEILDPAKTRERDRDPPLPPPKPLGDKLNEIRSELEPVSIADAVEVWETYQSAREEIGIARVLQHNGTDMMHLRAILELSGRSKGTAKHVVKAFVASNGTKNYWKDRKWPLWLLAETKNFEQCRSIAAERLGKGQGMTGKNLNAAPEPAQISTQDDPGEANHG